MLVSREEIEETGTDDPARRADAMANPVVLTSAALGA